MRMSASDKLPPNPAARASATPLMPAIAASSSIADRALRASAAETPGSKPAPNAETFAINAVFSLILPSLCVHKRINEPNDGGGSSYRKSIKLDPLLNEYCKKLCKAINYTGVLMIEFKKSSGIYYFMEINPRFWGSLELSINSNINFPLDLINLFKNDIVQKPIYVSERYSRHLYKDLGWVIKEMKNKNDPSIFIYWLYSFKNLFLGKESFDVEKYYDLKPMFAQYFLLVLGFFKKIKRKKSILFRKPKRAKLSINKKTKVLFVCKGNINRSAFAEIYLTSKGFKNVKSAGTINREGRKSSQIIENIAKDNYFIDMSKHRSKYLKEKDFLNSDVVFYFDNENFLEIKKRFPNNLNKLFFIGCQTKDINTIKERKKEIETDIAKLNNELKELEESKNEKTKQSETLQLEVDTLETEINALNVELNRLKESRDKKTTEINQQNDIITEITSEISTNLKNIDNLTTEKSQKKEN